MRSHARGVIALVVMIYWLGNATPAHAAFPSVAVLGIEPFGVPDTVAQQVTDALRRSIKNGTFHRQVQGKDLVELKMVFGCDKEAPACLAQAGKSLGADKLLFGRVKRTKQPGTILVELQLLDVNKAVVLGSLSETLRRDEIGAHVDAWLGKLFGIVPVAAAPPEPVTPPTPPPPPPSPTVLSVSTTPSGAIVTLDGTAVGQTPLELTPIDVGTHRVTIALDGFEISNRTFTIAAGQRQVVQLQLTETRAAAIAQTPATPPSSEPQQRVPTNAELRNSRILTGIGAATIVVGGVLGGLSIWTWYHYTTVENNLSNHVPLFVPSRAPSAAESQWLQHPNCSPPSTLSEFGNIQSFAHDCKSGHAYANATTALLTTSTILGVSGIAMIVIAAQMDARARRGGDSARKPTAFQLVPTLAPGMLGMSAVGRF